MVLSQRIRVAILECGETVPKVSEVYGPYQYPLFTKCLDQAARRSTSTIKLEFSLWDVLKDKYPSPDEVDAIIISGSHNSAYDSDPWVRNLSQFIQQTYQSHPQIRFFGSCFGHQIISWALLKKCGVVVEKDPKGYELGVGTIDLSPEFASKFRQYLVPEHPSQLQIQFSHGDHVHCPPGSLPPSWECIGTSSHCGNQGYFEPGRVLTFQGHFEFDSFVTTEIIKHYYTEENGFAPKVVRDALDAAARSDDATQIADIVYAFLTAES